MIWDRVDQTYWDGEDMGGARRMDHIKKSKVYQEKWSGSIIIEQA